MSDDEVAISIYVLPSEQNQPPRAMLIKGEVPQVEPGDEIQGVLVTWQSDSGVWTYEGGMPLDAELGAAVTEHAKSLGVPGW